jgi:energy-coupling factor transporter ATP-binding protein EcfA2
MYLKKVRLENIACFEDLTLDLTREGRPCPWVVILGENGSGKSTLLQMIALSLLGSEMIHEIAGGVEWSRFARSSADPGRIAVELQPTRGDVIGMAPPRIFLSYAPQDRSAVERLYERLAEVGFKPWMAAKDIAAGESWKRSLYRAMSTADLVLVCLSEHSLVKGASQPEIRQAIDLWQRRPAQEIYLIPVRLEPCDVPLTLSDLIGVDLFQDDGFERLVEAVHTAMARPRPREWPEPRDGVLAADRNGLRVEAIYELGPTIRSGLREAESTRRKRAILDHSLYDQSLNGGWFACAYGPWRRLSRAKAPNRSSQALTSSRRKSHRFATMFEEESALTMVNDWLIDLEFRRLKDPEDLTAGRVFDLAVRSLERMLPGVRFRKITPEGEVVFEESGVEVPIHSLSDGYRSTLAWVGDLVRRLVDAFPEAEDPLAASGVVLVDEIDLHLHPKWQRSIVDEVRSLFPNLQFIVSSHSPFVAQDVGEADKIIVLRKEEGHVSAREELESVKGWRVDQILTSYLFDLETTRDASLEAIEREYQSLLDREARGEATDTDEQRARELREWLDQHKSAPGETVAENELFDAARSFITLIDQKLAR